MSDDDENESGTIKQPVATQAGKKLVRRYQELVSDRKVVEGSWDLIERFVYPLGGGKYFQPLSSEGEVNWRRRNIYDDTAILGADTLAASIHGSLTSPAVKWFDFTFADLELNSDIESKTWLENCGLKVWDTLQQSNFNLEVSEGYLDLTAFGNTCMAEVPKDDLTWKGVTFDSVPLRDCYFEEDEFGQILKFYRRLMWKPSQIVSKFGYDNCPQFVCDAFDSAVSSSIELIFTVCPCPENEGADTLKVMPVDKRPFKSAYYFTSNATQIGETGGFYEMPAYMVRWRRTSGSQWGYGPSHIALSTIMTLNELCKLVLESAEKVVDPASLIAQRGLLSDLDLTAGGQTVVKDVDKSIKAYESGARFDVSAMKIADLQMMVKRIYHVDQLELKESPAMSATEVMVRYELMNRLLGPTMGRLQNDLLDPLVTNTFKMLYRAGQFPKAPDKVREAGGVMNVEYSGPLSRAQKSDEVASVERWLGDIANFSQLFPELRHVPDPKEVAIYLSDGLSVPSKLMRSNAKINSLIKEDEQIKQDAVANANRKSQLEEQQLANKQPAA